MTPNVRIKRGYYAGDEGEYLPLDFWLWGLRVRVKMQRVPCVVLPKDADWVTDDYYIYRWFWVWNLEKTDTITKDE